MEGTVFRDKYTLLFVPSSLAKEAFRWLDSLNKLLMLSIKFSSLLAVIEEVVILEI